MNLPNAVQSQHYQNESIDFGVSSAHFNESDKDHVESSLSTSGNDLHTIRQNNLCYFGFDKYFDPNATEYRENSFESNTIANQHQYIQSIAYNTNSGEINQPPNEMGKRLLFC